VGFWVIKSAVDCGGRTGDDRRGGQRVMPASSRRKISRDKTVYQVVVKLEDVKPELLFI
jgi:hypothetical protein